MTLMRQGCVKIIYMHVLNLNTTNYTEFRYFKTEFNFTYFYFYNYPKKRKGYHEYSTTINLYAYIWLQFGLELSVQIPRHT